MQHLNVIDVFCGSGSFGKVSRSYGFNVFSVDVRNRKGVCEPDLHIDLEEVPGTYFLEMNPFIMWFGLPCDIWSRASGGFHLSKDFKPKTEKAVKHLRLFEKTIQIIRESKPKFWVIENPNGNLHKYPGLIDFIAEENATVYFVTLVSYGFPTIKPTVLITNCLDLNFLPCAKFGRGYKNPNSHSFHNMTKVRR